MNVKIWLFTALTTLTIFILVPTARPISKFGTALFHTALSYDAPILVGFIILIGFFFAIYCLVILGQKGFVSFSASPPYFRSPHLSRFLCVLGLSGALFVSHLPIEYAHIPVYGLLGLFAASSFERATPQFRFVKTLAFCVVVSLCDEMLQGLHPERFFDLRDLVLNGLSSLAGILFRDLRATSILRAREAKFL